MSRIDELIMDAVRDKAFHTTDAIVMAVQKRYPRVFMEADSTGERFFALLAEQGGRSCKIALWLVRRQVVSDLPNLMSNGWLSRVRPNTSYLPAEDRRSVWRITTTGSEHVPRSVQTGMLYHAL